MAETWQNAMESRDPPTFQQQLLQLRQQQELQQQILMQQFQAQQQQLSEQHEQQLQQHIKHVWWQQLQLMSSSGGGSACSSTTSPPASIPPSGAGRHSSGSGTGPESLPAGSSGDAAAHPHDVTMATHEDAFVEQRLHQHQRHRSEELGNPDSSPPAVVGSSGSCSTAAAETPLSDWREPVGAAGGSSRLELLKKKEAHQQSAVASTEVKQRLQEFVLQKRQREAAAANSPYHSGVRGTLAPQRSFIDKSSSSAHPYRPAAVSKFDEEYCPLRKTASEPNIGLKARIKQRVLDRCSASPSQRRKLQHQQHLQEHVGPIKLKNKHTLDSSTSTPDSELSSPSGLNYSAQPSANSTIHEEGTSAFSLSMNSSGCVPPLSLYSSPSMPNISLGRPPVHPTSTPNTAPGSVDGEMVLPRHYPSILPLAGHFLPPFYPVLPVIEGEFTPPTSPAYIHKQMQYLEQQQAAAAAIGRPSNHLLTAAAAAAYLPPGYQAAADPSSHVQEAGRSASGRPLNRTHSAPLPLGHPMLQNSVAAAAISRQQYELLLRDRRAIYEQQQHGLLKQHIRQTVLTRAGSKTQVENVEEETEAAVAREMQQDSHQHPSTNHSTMVIDLTDGRRASQQERDAGAAPVTSTSPCHIKSPTPDVMGRPGVRALHMIRPLARARSSPLVTLGPTTSPDSGSTVELTYVSKQGQGTGLVYDPLMLKHQCVCGDASNHLEHSTRLQAIWSRLQDAELVQRCDRVRSRKATVEELQTCHSQAHAVFFGTNPFSRQKLDLSGLASELPLRSFVKMPCGGVGVDLDTTWNELHTSSAARMATGCVTELAFQVAAGRVGNGFALVRPPGHHAEHQQAMGFCFFNSVAVAARLLRLQLNVEKVLIVDWDVHHGNGTQQIFYESSHVLYMSLHRHDNGNFFPGTGATIECGAENGMGFNVNVAWSGGEAMADAEYLAAFRTIVMPIARDFQPDVVLVSSGFDAAAGHAAPLGGYRLSPACFGWMTRQLMSLANGKVVLALEGGYHIPAVCDATEHCVRALLGESLQPLCDDQLNRKPCQSAIETLQKTIAVQIPHWPCVKRTAHLVNVTHSEALRDSTAGAAKAVEAMAGLSVMPQSTNCPPASDNSPPASLISSTVVRSPVRQVSGSPTGASDEPMEEGDSNLK